MRPLGIFGGTFDPVHYGHLRTAFELLEALGLEEIRFIPAGQPPHRGAPRCNAPHRMAMVRAAIAGQQGFVADDREVKRQEPSWTVTTLRELRSEAPEKPLCLVIGTDAFLGLPQWHEWLELPKLAHLVIASRPGTHLPREGVLGDLLAQRSTTSVSDLHAAAAGLVFVYEGTPLEISSTALREMIVAGRDPRYLLPDAVRAYIRDTACYLPQPTR
jgi:nicotinate-nucleotide adenylyltransferase